MRRFFLALGLFLSLAYSADAASVRGAADLNTAIRSETLISKAACGYDEYYCSRGSQRVCRHGRCWCAPCGGRYYGPGYAPPPPPYYGPGPGYGPPPGYYRRPRYHSPDCGPGWSFQDGQCKPYTGR